MESSEVKISLSITPTWSILKEVQEKAERFMKEKKAKDDVIEAAIMCSAELVENAIKYGSASSHQDNISFELGTSGNQIVIKVANGIKDDNDIKNVKEHLTRLKSSNDAGKLYTERLQELMENPKPGVSQLGLYRIAYEGEFDLSYTYDKKLLTIIATRSFTG